MAARFGAGAPQDDLARDQRDLRFIHRGSLYSSDRHLAEALTSRARPAIERGDAVLVLVTPPVEAVVRDQLGVTADRVGFRPHAWLGRKSATAIVDSAFDEAGVRSVGAHVTLLCQQPRHDESDDEFWLAAELATNATLVDQPVDLTCFVDQSSTARNVRMTRLSHPVLDVDDVDVASPHYTPPDQILFDWPDGMHKPRGLDPVRHLHAVSPDNPADARNWLRTMTGEAGMSESVMDGVVVVAGEAVMTGWEAATYLSVPGSDSTRTRLAGGHAEAGDRIHLVLWRTPDGVACDVLVPVTLTPLSPTDLPKDVRMRWLWMASAITPQARLSIFDRDDRPGTCIRVRVSEA